MTYLSVVQVCQDLTAGIHNTGFKRVFSGLHTKHAMPTEDTQAHRMTTQDKWLN